MGQILEYIKIAFKSILGNKMRSLLTMLGIIIGISSVIAIMGLGNGVSGYVEELFNGSFAGQTYIMCISESITIDDIEDILDQVPNVSVCSMEDATYGTSYSKKGKFTTYIKMVNQTYVNSAPTQGFVDGRYFTKEEYDRAARVCVILENSAMNLFGTKDVVGKSIMVDVGYGTEEEFEIVGVRELNKGKAYTTTYVYDDVEMDIPYTTYLAITGIEPEDCYIDQVMFMLNSTEIDYDAIDQAVKIINHNHGFKKKDHEVYVQDIQSYTKQINQILGYVTVFISCVAAIALFVGGIGVMNIMLVSVTERTSEIGIRKALGAKTGSIIWQFLAESAIISLIGGIIGMILGYLFAALLCLIAGAAIGTGITASIDIWTVLGVVVFSTAVGVFFGIYPAMKAAKLSPIEALRQE